MPERPGAASEGAGVFRVATSDDAVLVATAAGDGTTDDAEAIQAAIAQAAGRQVLIEPGTYRIGSAITVPSGTRLRGSGRGTTTLLFTGEGAAIQSPDSTVVGVTISDLTVRGSNASDPTDTTQTAGIDFARHSGGYRHVHVERVTVERFAGGIGVALGGLGALLCSVRDCDVLDAGVGVRLYRAFNCDLNGSLIRRWARNGVEVEGLEGGSAAVGNRIEKCVIDEPLDVSAACQVRSGVSLVRSTMTTIASCYFEQVRPPTDCAESTVPIRLVTAARGTQINGNYFGPNNVADNDTGAVIVIADATCSDTRIEGNQIGFAYGVEDNGTRTVFAQTFAGTGGLTGSPSLQLGWVADSEGNVTEFLQ